MACNALQQESAAIAKTATESQQYTAVSSPFQGELSSYWYQGEAEISTYELTQVRYGDVHPGVVTNIFVSEDFLTDKQVKNDNYRNPNTTPILKMNQVKRFTTGIYDYSVMTSVFTPTDLGKHPHTLKVSLSSQDWCGQSFAQLNYRGGQVWGHQIRSYFESEGDAETQLEAAWLEDEIFTRLRIDPEGLPLGEQNILPSLAYLRFVHKSAEPMKAITKREIYTGKDFTGSQLKVYSINYPALDRELALVYEAASPYLLKGWTESYPSNGRKLTTVASLKHHEMRPYWQQNSNKFAEEREPFGLSNFSE